MASSMLLLHIYWYGFCFLHTTSLTILQYIIQNRYGAMAKSELIGHTTSFTILQYIIQNRYGAMAKSELIGHTTSFTILQYIIQNRYGAMAKSELIGHMFFATSGKIPAWINLHLDSNKMVYMEVHNIHHTVPCYQVVKSASVELVVCYQAAVCVSLPQRN